MSVFLYTYIFLACVEHVPQQNANTMARKATTYAFTFTIPRSGYSMMFYDEDDDDDDDETKLLHYILSSTHCFQYVQSACSAGLARPMDGRAPLCAARCLSDSFVCHFGHLL